MESLLFCYLYSLFFLIIFPLNLFSQLSSPKYSFYVWSDIWSRTASRRVSRILLLLLLLILRL